MKIYNKKNYSILTGNKYKNYYNEENIKFYTGIMVSLKDFENLNLSHSEYLKFDFTLKIPVHASR